MDEERQPGGAGESHNGTGQADTAAWQSNGTLSGGHVWSHADATLEPSGESVGSPRRGFSHWAFGGDEYEAPDSGPPYPYESDPPAGEGVREPAPGLDDDTPPGGLPVAEPPLWREATHHAPGYGAQLAEYAEYASPLSAVRTEPAPVPTPASAPPGPSAELGWDSPPESEPESLPKRVPAEPELPCGVENASVSAEPPERADSAGERWTAPELARIADELRRDDVPREAPSTEGFDVDEVLEAVRGVAGVRAASLRANPNGVHTLRLDLADDADPGLVSRVVARMLGERMGLSTTAPHVPQAGRSAPAASHRQPEPAGPQAPASAPRQETPFGPARHADAGFPRPPRGESGGAAVRDDSPPPPRAESREHPPDRPREPAPPQESRADVPPEEPVEAESRPLPPPPLPGVRVVIDHVQVNMFGLDATVEVRLAAGDRRALGLASGPAVDGYVTRLAAVSAAKAIDQLLHQVDPDGDSGRCFVEHTGVVPFGTTEVAVVVVQLVCEGWVEQLAGCAVVTGDPRQAVVRATLGAVNRRLEALLS